jgi:hypothetical protein
MPRRLAVVRLRSVSAIALVLGAAGVGAGPAAATGGAASTGSAASAASPPSVRTVSRIAVQDVPALPGSEPDTLAEPDVAVSPRDSRIAVAVAQDGRYPDGGAVGISYSWTRDGGLHWHHQPLPGVTSATGGDPTWARATDPVAAFDAAGRAYVSTLLFNTGCDSAVAVSRSADGGRTFGAPVLVHRSSTCAVSDDKNWLVVDTGRSSPHRGRLYQFWTPFLLDPFGNADGSPQAVAWSDDQGRTWTKPVAVSAPHANTQNAQPMFRRDGTVVDSYLDSGAQPAGEGPEAAQARHTAARVPPRPRAAAEAPEQKIVTRVSRDGGAHWTEGGTVTEDVGEGPAGIRCCLPTAASDPVTGRMYVAWSATDPRRLLLSTSTDGRNWSAPRRMNPGVQRAQVVNADVAAYGGTLAVSYALTNAATSPDDRIAQQRVVTSRDAGVHLTTPTVIGPVSDYAGAAQAGGIFPGDYIGTALRGHRLYAVWCVSKRPSRAGARFHQVEYGATFDVRPAGRPRG